MAPEFTDNGRCPTHGADLMHSSHADTESRILELLFEIDGLYQSKLRLSGRQIGRVLDVPASTVSLYIREAIAAGYVERIAREGYGITPAGRAHWTKQLAQGSRCT